MDLWAWLDEKYPPFDPLARIDVEGQAVRYLSAPDALNYEHEPDFEVLQKTPSLLPPEEHMIRKAVSINVVHTLLKQNRHVLEYVFALSETLYTNRLLRQSERYLSDCLTLSPVHKASLVRVLKENSSGRINLMSPHLQKLVAELNKTDS